MKKILIPCLLAFMLLGCNESGPQKALNQTAKALDEHNAQAFLAQLDMGAYADNYIRSLAGSDQTLNSLNALGQMFGIGNLDNLIGSIVDMKARLSEQFNRGVASGEMMAECRTSTTADCPWVPQSLREAQVVELSSTAAIAKVTTPERLVCWIALRKSGEAWRIVGQAVMEDRARSMALGDNAQSAPQQEGQQDQGARL